MVNHNTSLDLNDLNIFRHEFRHYLGACLFNLHVVSATLKGNNVTPPEELNVLKKLLMECATLFDEHTGQNACEEKVIANMSYEIKKIAIEKEASNPSIHWKWNDTTRHTISCGLSLRQLRQLLNNIYTNAIESLQGQSEPFSPKIYTTLYDAEGLLYLEIHDNGLGFPKHIYPKHLLRPYTSTKTSDNTAIPRGIGLHIVQQIVNEASGTVELLPSIYTGACVRIVLPMRQATLVSTNEKESRYAT